MHAPQALSGIGEDAFAITLGAPVVQIHFYKDAAYVTVVVTNLNDPQRMEKAKALAAGAAARLYCGGHAVLPTIEMTQQRRDPA